jgi:sugar lactone lactonase YvrE
MAQLLDPNAKPEKVAGGFRFTEGPVCSRIGYLLFSDIPANQILRWEKGKVTVFRENSNGANGNTFDHQGRLLTCENERVTRTEKDGKITVLAGGMKKPNDLVYAIDGSVYFSDLPAGAVYQVTRKAEVRVVARDCERPNGVALSPNQQKLYVADSGRRNLRVYDVAADGALGPGRVFAEMGQDVPDGLKTDEAGNVWVAGTSGIWIFNATGKHLSTAAIPEAPSNCNWGEGFHDLYVTARTSLYRLRTRTNGTRTY